VGTGAAGDDRLDHYRIYISHDRLGKSADRLTCWIIGEALNGRSRREAVAAGRSGEVRLTERTADPLGQ
jgi:hypothetical protein